jgi:hypothetical protein
MKFIFWKGDWDHGGFSDKVYSMSSNDEGRSSPLEKEIELRAYYKLVA